MPSSRYYKFKIENQKGKTKRFKILFFVFSASIAIFAIIWLIFMSPIFRINDIEISDNNYLNGASLTQQLRGDNLVILSKSRLKSELSSAFPSIMNIEITKKLFHTIKIDFQNRVQVGIWCHPSGGHSQGDNCYYFDKEGILFKETPQTEGGLIFKVIDKFNSNARLGDKILDNEKISFIIAFSSRVNENNKFKILEFKIKPTPSVDLEAVTDQGWFIYLDETQDPVIATANLFTVLNESIKNSADKLAYIDLRIPNGRIFYCPFGQKCADR